MSGRAGRRGKDDKGIVIMMVDEKMDSAVAKELVKGKVGFCVMFFFFFVHMICVDFSYGFE